MSTQDPERLSKSSDDPLLRELLESGRRELPTEAQLASLATKLGSVTGGGGGDGDGGAGARAAATKIGGVGAVKATALLLVVTAAVWGVSHLEKKPPRHMPPRPAAASSAAAELLRQVLAEPDASESADDSDQHPDALDLSLPLPTIASAVPRASASVAPPKPVLPPASASASELKLLQRAQDALIEDPGAALRAVDEDVRLYPDGVLRQEAEVIAIDALARTGHVPAAEARAAKFRAAYPQSTHLRRIDAILAH